MKIFWLSWNEPSEDYRPVTFPPNDAVLGWWCTGEGEGYVTLCAMVFADSEEAARRAVRDDWPGEKFWRFCEERGSISLSDRFPLSDWMKPRMEMVNKVLDPGR